MGASISWLALVIGLIAVAYAWKLQQELQTTTRRLDRYNRALFDVNDELRKAREEMTSALAGVQAQMLLPNGAHALFAPQMKVSDALTIHPQAEQILAAFHLGGCNSCAVDSNDTLAAVCQENGRDLLSPSTGPTQNRYYLALSGLSGCSALSDQSVVEYAGQTPFFWVVADPCLGSGDYSDY